LLSALTIAHRSLAQNGQKPAPIKNISDFPLEFLSGWLETCMNLPRTFFGMKVLLLLLVPTTRACSVVYLLMFGTNYNISNEYLLVNIPCPHDDSATYS
jgi:hypothetical protein